MEISVGKASGGRLRISSRMTPGRMIIPVAGEVDHTTAPQLRAALLPALTSGARQVELDFTQVSFCDCSGLNTLLDAYHHARQTGVCFGVSGPLTPAVARLFALAEVESVLATPPRSWPWPRQAR
ncbi:STAS domain-containing protein [Streptomyces sp. NPDC101152]|uniref:STAS domain-containing protein n=1 Tax=Streptomyces sp. NPDC101152 TaxID=3366116 RepID=UPI003806A546